MKKTLLSLALTALLSTGTVASFAADTGPADFQVDESFDGGSLVTADLINGGYREKITFDATVTNFDTAAFAVFSQFYLDPSATPLSGPLLGGDYRLYAVMYETGTVAQVLPGLFAFTGGTGSMEFYLDKNADTTGTLGTTGSDPITLANISDDLLLGSSTNIVAGTGLLVSGVGGFFDIWFADIDWTTDGLAYFVDPDPFYVKANVDGDFNTFNVAGTQEINGDVSIIFAVPEPGALALMGLGLLGMGFARRNRKES